LIDSAAGTIFDRNIALLYRALALQGMANRADALRDLQAIVDSKKYTPELRNAVVIEQFKLHRELEDWQAVLRDAAILRPIAGAENQAWLLMAVFEAHSALGDDEKSDQ